MNIWHTFVFLTYQIKLKIVQGRFSYKLIMVRYQYDYFKPDNRSETHLTSLCNWGTKNKVVLFLYYTCHGMNFQGCEFKSFGCTKICNDSKWTETSRNEVIQFTASNKLRPIFPYHVHNQADFDNPFINGRGCTYLGISKMSFTF